MLYAIIIVLTVAICESASLGVYFARHAVSLAYAICAPLFCVLFCGLLLGVLDMVIRLLPHECWAYDKRPFYVDKKEARFYEKLGIKRWKDKAVPELGASAGFSKKNLKGTSADYLARFLRETCQGEALHGGGALLGSCFLAVYPVRDWYFVAPILLVNFAINLLPCMIQRYNRYRLGVVYRFKARQGEAARAEAGGANAAISDIKKEAGCCEDSDNK